MNTQRIATETVVWEQHYTNRANFGEWRNYRETVYGKNVDVEWFSKNIIRPAVEFDPTVAPFDTWRIVERNGGLQAQIARNES